MTNDRDDHACAWCDSEIAGGDTIVITPRGQIHSECWAVSGEDDQ